MLTLAAQGVLAAQQQGVLDWINGKAGQLTATISLLAGVAVVYHVVKEYFSKRTAAPVIISLLVGAFVLWAIAHVGWFSDRVGGEVDDKKDANGLQVNMIHPVVGGGSGVSIRDGRR
jgi:hypothetical protein